MSRRILIRGGETVTAYGSLDRRHSDRGRPDRRSRRGVDRRRRGPRRGRTPGAPGGVDVHTHIDYDTGRARTADTFETATRAAAFGGTTTVVDFAFQPRHSSKRDRGDGRLVGESRDGVRRRRRPYDPHNGDSGDARRDARACSSRRRDERQAVYGLSRHADGGRRRDLSRHAAGWRRRRPGLSPRRERRVIETLIEEALAAGHTAPRYHASTRPSLTKARRCIAPSPSRNSRARRSTSSMSRRAKGRGDRARARPRICRSTPRRVRIISSSTNRPTTPTI